MVTLSNLQARQFLLLKHGLLGSYKFSGKEGALDFVRQAGCIQFDPVDVCGKNAELTLQSRVKGFRKQTLYELLYKDRALLDYPDKNLSIILTEDFPYFLRYRQAAREGGRSFEGLAELERKTLDYIAHNGPVSSDTLPVSGTMFWHSHIHWSGNWGGQTNAARAVLEQLYSTGELVIYSKNGSRKIYDLAEKHISPDILNADDPLPEEFAHQKWRVLRRIGAVGLLWNRPSDAWLNIWNLKAPQRDEIFRQLLEEEKIAEVKVEGIKNILYCRSEDLPLLDTVRQKVSYAPRCELLAPLDCMMWDRKLIKALFGFDYTWEIYTPAEKRKYGFYVLPVIYGDKFAGRAEIAADKKTDTLIVKNIWYEEGVKQNKTLAAAIDKCMRRFARFNECGNIARQDKPMGGGLDPYGNKRAGESGCRYDRTTGGMSCE
ncbi:MAG: winged helix-turn-helix domain-containing protein [Marvinbryantia sp.]|uniref:winged helix-turn-helix domain-containing protein n=1 Tax=Marvinbryantia sp. TaxID=2496532 RepID=UPI0025E6A6D0|nr:crosslink repair DNA glycosylase YcaQ family protein [uncultured Marvinbryantia sp.]